MIEKGIAVMEGSRGGKDFTNAVTQQDVEVSKLASRLHGG